MGLCLDGLGFVYRSGYTLSIVSSTGLTELDADEVDDGDEIESITSELSNYDFSNDANTQYNNKWGYKPSHRALESFNI